MKECVKMSNLKYGKLITDEKYLEGVLEEAILKVEEMQNDVEYSSDDAKEIIVNWLDDIGIYPSDLDYIMEEIEF